MISPIQPVNCVLSKPDTKISYISYITVIGALTSLAQIRPKPPEIARNEEDHLCRVPHLRKSDIC